MQTRSQTKYQLLKEKNDLKKPTSQLQIQKSKSGLKKLTKREEKSLIARNLYTIFKLYGKNGLTTFEVYEKVHEHNKRVSQKDRITGYDGMAPDAIVRGNITRWNKMTKTPRLYKVKEKRMFRHFLRK